MRAYFGLDRRLARIVSATTEPMLGQMRLAWWRDMLLTPPSDRPNGDAVLDGVSNKWGGGEATLIELVDAWEVLVVAEQIGQSEIEVFTAGRAAPFTALIEGGSPTDAASILSAASVWVLADAASRVSQPEELNEFLTAASSYSTKSFRLPRELRGLAVLTALARRSLKRGGRPMMEGRSAALVAIRAGIFGR